MSFLNIFLPICYEMSNLHTYTEKKYSVHMHTFKSISLFFALTVHLRFVLTSKNDKLKNSYKKRSEEDISKVNNKKAVATRLFFCRWPSKIIPTAENETAYNMLTLLRPEDRLCPPHYYLPPRIFRPSPQNAGSLVSVSSIALNASNNCCKCATDS